jgi:hypothetical protein
MFGSLLLLLLLLLFFFSPTHCLFNFFSEIYHSACKSLLSSSHQDNILNRIIRVVSHTPLPRRTARMHPLGTQVLMTMFFRSHGPDLLKNRNNQQKTQV